MTITDPMPVAVLISGHGSNLRALIEHAPNCGIRIVLVISNVPDARGLALARRANIATEVLAHSDYTDREAYDRALSSCIDGYHPALLLLAGFMRILTSAFVARYQGRLLNIHPSLLPAYRGLHTHRRVLAAGEHEHGCSVHFVTAELDGGPIIVQSRLAVLPDDDEHSLAARVLEQEHKIYPLAVSWFSAGRLRLDHGRVLLDGRPAPTTGYPLQHLEIAA